MASWVLFISSLSALALLVLHSWRRRGGRVTAAFFIGGAVFGVLRGNVVWAICRYCLGAGTNATPYLPQGRMLPHLGHESLQVVIGWLFASYLAWTLSEFALRRVGREDRLFPTVALSALFMACIGYSTEAVATRVGWWYWDFSTANVLFGHVPTAGIAAWFSVATDFIFPVLLIACSEYRSRLRWLALLVFPLHMGAHALYNVVPYIDDIYPVIVLAVAALALFGQTRLVTGFAARPEGARRGLIDLIPAAAVATYLAVILWAALVVAGDAESACAAIPLGVFAALAIVPLQLVVVAVLAAVGVGAWGIVGFRAIYVFAPLAAFAALSSRGAVRFAWGGVVLVLAGLFTAGETQSHLRMKDYVGLLRAGQAERALAMKFTDADDLWWSTRLLLAAGADNQEEFLPEVLRRYEAMTKADPRWTGPWIEWAGWLAVDNQLFASIDRCRVAVRTEPTVGSHHATLGYFLLRAGRIGEAREELRKAADLGYDGSDARTNLAVALACEGEAGRAKELLSGHRAGPVAELDAKQLESAPAKVKADLAHIAAPETYEFLGPLMYQRASRSRHSGKMGDAAEWCLAAAHYAPKDVLYRTNLVVFLAQSGRLEEAVDQCELAVGLDSGSGIARRYFPAFCIELADEQARRGEIAAARATLIRALPFVSGPEEIAVRLRIGGLH